MLPSPDEVLAMFVFLADSLVLLIVERGALGRFSWMKEFGLILHSALITSLFL